MTTYVNKITDDQAEALDRFIVNNGTDKWVACLLDHWRNGTEYRYEDLYKPSGKALVDDGCYLRQIRNTKGPSWLTKYGKLRRAMTKSIGNEALEVAFAKLTEWTNK